MGASSALWDARSPVFTRPGRPQVSAAAACTATARLRARSSAAAFSPAARQAGPPRVKRAEGLLPGDVGDGAERAGIAEYDIAEIAGRFDRARRDRAALRRRLQGH